MERGLVGLCPSGFGTHTEAERGLALALLEAERGLALALLDLRVRRRPRPRLRRRVRIARRKRCRPRPILSSACSTLDLFLLFLV